MEVTNQFLTQFVNRGHLLTLVHGLRVTMKRDYTTAV